MDSISTTAKFLRRLVVGAVILLCSGSWLSAQSTGTIAGRVFDSANGRALQGAVVKIAGSSAQDISGVDGRYLITGVPAGTATVQVDYVGLDPLAETVTVTAGSVTLHDAGLKSAVLVMEALTVSDSVRGQALAINQQKTASGIVNIVSEETFGQMPDGNIGAAIQRLPGLSVSESQDGSPSNINIRGIVGDYNSVQIDGNRAPNSGGGNRSFDPRQLTADGVTNIEVIKAPTPDRDGDAIGGIVNVVSRNAFQRDGRSMRLKLSGVYSDLPKKWGHAASLTYSDLFNIFGKQKNLGITATLSSYRTNRYSINADIDWENVTHALYPTLGLDQYGDRPVWFMEATHFEYNNRVTDTYGVSGSIDFRTDEHNSFYFRPVYSHYDRAGTTFETDIDIDTRYQAEPGGRRTYSRLTPDSGAGTPGSSGSQGSRGWIGTDDIADNNLYSINFGGRHERQDNLLTYDFFYSFSKLNVTADNELDLLMKPTNPYLTHEYRILDINTGLTKIDITNGGDPTNLSQMTLGNVIFFTSKKSEYIYSARADWEKKFASERGAFTLKTGVKFRSSEPKFDRTLTRDAVGPAFPFSQVMEPTGDNQFGKLRYFDVYPNRIPAIKASNPGLFTYQTGASVEGSNLADYDAKESTGAAYVMGTYRFGAHTIIGGVRFEDNKWESRRTRVEYPGGVATPRPENINNSYDHWLPGLHLRHELRPNLIMRESYNRSYGRPSLSQLTLGRLVATNGNITDGNPNLQPVTSHNFDAQIEYYTANSGLYSAGVFYKDVENFSYQLDSRFTSLDANGNPIIIPGATSGLRYRRIENGSSAKQYGLELIARQRLTFLPGLLNGLSASGSATWTESEAHYPHRTVALGGDGRTGLTLPGFSPLLYTLALEYARGRFFGRVDYRYRDDFVEGLGTSIASDEYFGNENRLDAEVSYEIRRGLSLYASGTNLTGDWQLSYQGYPQFVEDASYSGRKFTFGVEYKF